MKFESFLSLTLPSFLAKGPEKGILSVVTRKELQPAIVFRRLGAPFAPPRRRRISKEPSKPEKPADDPENHVLLVKMKRRKEAANNSLTIKEERDPDKPKSRGNAPHPSLLSQEKMSKKLTAAFVGHPADDASRATAPCIFVINLNTAE